MITELSPDLLLLDIYLNNEMDGIDIARRTQLINSSINIIFITGYRQNIYSDQLEGIHYLAFLEKPVDIQQITATIYRMNKDLV